MTSTHASAPPTGPVVPSVADAARDLASAVDALASADRETCRAVLALSRTTGTGVCEAVEGLPPDLVLANLCRLVRADRSTILTAADVLRSMPATATLWQAGVLSWGQVRNLCLRASKLRADDREVLDRRLAATAEDADAYGPDGLLDAVDRAIWDLEDVAKAERAEECREQADFLSLQAALDGGVRLYGEYGPLQGAKITNALRRGPAGRRRHDARPAAGDRARDVGGGAPRGRTRPHRQTADRRPGGPEPGDHQLGGHGGPPRRRAPSHARCPHRGGADRGRRPPRDVDGR